jgi:addiction module RelE/StbE family toxin
MKIALREEAVADLENIYAFIAQDSEPNARKVLSHIWATVTNLISAHPDIGRAGRAKGTRELPVRGLSYIIVYQVDKERGVLNIVNVLHGARER